METLYYNGDIITMEGEGQYVEAVLVVDGKIKAAGAYDEVAAQKRKAKADKKREKEAKKKEAKNEKTMAMIAKVMGRGE